MTRVGATDDERRGGGSRRAVGVTLRPRHGDAAAVGADAPYATACAAAAIQLRFDPNGLVTTCCKSAQPLGHISHERLPAIWDGATRHRLVDALERDDFSVGCQRCEAEIANEGRAVSYAAIHDQWSGHLTADPASRAWPVRMEFNLSNSCNLQCIQCDGESSSSIRIHREHRPPLPQVYGDDFFEDLALFLPHLDRIVFAGGEPFLGAENFRVWDMIAAGGYPIDCVVVTNATQWTPRIEALLERVRFSFIFSIDGITASTYESIRVGADFDDVMANVERFRAYAERSGSTATVNHCLMPQNAHEFADLLLWAEDRGLHVDVSVVRSPPHASIAQLPVDEIRRIADVFEARDAEVRGRLHRNAATWDAERTRIAAWARTGETGESTSGVVLWFQRAGAGPTDPSAIEADLAGWADEGVVNCVSIGSDGHIRSADVPELTGFGRAGEPHLVGGLVHDFTKAVVTRFGEMNDYEVLTTGDDLVEARAVFGDVPARISTIAVRDAAGWADEARIVVAFRPSEAGRR